MNPTIRRSLTTLAGLALAASMSQSAFAADGRHAFKPEIERTSEVHVTAYDRPATVERYRSELKKAAVFYADPQEIEKNAIVLFEAFSVSGSTKTPRWRCIAIDDVAECLGAPVTIKYLPSDEKVVLVATAKPRTAPETMALIDQLKTEPNAIAAQELPSR